MQIADGGQQTMENLISRWSIPSKSGRYS